MWTIRRPKFFFRQPNSSKRSKRNHHNLKVDRLSQLPDELIGCILSHLSFKEVVLCSVLSRRWKNLWTYCSGSNLVFNDNVKKWRWTTDPVFKKRRSDLTCKFVAAVNRVLELHQEKALDEFTVSYHLESGFANVIDAWLAFAFRKGVKRLEFDFTSFLCEKMVVLSTDQLKLHASHFAGGFHNLKEVCFTELKIDEMVIGYLLSNCQFLERLRLRGVCGLDRLRVFSQSLKLLELYQCDELKSVEISASDLISLQYDGCKRLRLENVPKLSEFSAGRKHSKFILRMFPRVFSYGSQLMILRLEISSKMMREVASIPHEAIKFVMLQQLELGLKASYFHCLLCPLCLINTAPSLHRFVVNVQLTSPTPKGRHRSQCGRNARNAKTSPHQSLKVVEFRGFTIAENKVALARHLCHIGQSLEKVVIHTSNCDRAYLSCWSEELLNKELPPGVKFVVL